MPEKNYVKTKLVCRHNTEYPIYCVRSEDPVPQPLRCTPSAGGGSGASGGSSPACPCFANLSPGDLERLVNAATPPWGGWAKLGYVVVEI